MTIQQRVVCSYVCACNHMQLFVRAVTNLSKDLNCNYLHFPCFRVDTLWGLPTLRAANHNDTFWKLGRNDDDP